jgi:hypothetical protein
MPWRWPLGTPTRSGSQTPSYRAPASTTLTIAIVIVVVVAMLALAIWYSQ